LSPGQSVGAWCCSRWSGLFAEGAQASQDALVCAGSESSPDSRSLPRAPALLPHSGARPRPKGSSLAYLVVLERLSEDTVARSVCDGPRIGARTPSGVGAARLQMPPSFKPRGSGVSPRSGFPVYRCSRCPHNHCATALVRSRHSGQNTRDPLESGAGIEPFRPSKPSDADIYLLNVRLNGQRT
jgi:hypothetical protein